jgi:hypothetical protein
MSFDSHVCCMDCGAWLVVGKYVRIHDARLKQDVYGFAFLSDGHRDDVDAIHKSAWDQLHEKWRYLDHFLMRHRGHEIRVLPEELVGRFESEVFPVYRPEEPDVLDGTPHENYYLTPTGTPDQTRDAELAPEKVTKRLQELSDGINVGKPAWDDEQ